MSDKQVFKYIQPNTDDLDNISIDRNNFEAAKYQYRIFKWLEGKSIIVRFERGSAGNLVHRILGSHEPIYWSHAINNAYESETNPLKWPKKGYIERFLAQNSTCHTAHSFVEEGHQNRTADRIQRNVQILKAMKQNKIFVLLTHVDIRTLNKNIDIIRIVGDERRLRRKGIARPGRRFLEPIVEDNTYNLNINNLVDENYDIFEKEYLALCSQYKFTPNTKPVRDFILVWRSKQTLVNI
jgi:hypothetical protein